jgi:hypothetical protein
MHRDIFNFTTDMCRFAINEYLGQLGKQNNKEGRFRNIFSPNSNLISSSLCLVRMNIP